MRAEPLRFKKDGVYGVVSCCHIFFISLQVFSWNCHAFYHVCRYLLFKFSDIYSVFFPILWFKQVKDVFLPWYNAYRFLVQNAKRLEVEGFEPFVPIDYNTLQKSSNVLDQWINSATESLVHFVRQEMDAYRLYTVWMLTFVKLLTVIQCLFYFLANLLILCICRLYLIF